MKKEKLKNELYYLWTLYKFPLAAAVVVLVLVIGFIVAGLQKKDMTLEVMLLDCHADYSDEQMARDYMKAGYLDPKTQEVDMISTLMLQDSDSGTYTMTSLSRFLADIGSEKLDICGMLESDFIKYNESGSFLDLQTLLTEQELAALEGNLFSTEDGRITGIYIQALPGMKEWGCYTGDEPGVVGIIYNSKHLQEAEDYLIRYLAQLEEE